MLETVNHAKQVKQGSNIMGAIGLFLAKNWKEVIVAGAIILFVGYILTLRNMVDYYKSKVVKLERIVASLVVRNKELEGAATELTRKYEVRGSAIYKADEERARKNAERIANDQVTRRIRLPSIAVQLFNGTETVPEGNPASSTVEGNDGGASGSQATSGSSPEALTDATLNDLLAQSNENKKNHEKAVKQVKEWQSFWSDYVKEVEKADANTPVELPKKRFGIF